MCKNNSLNMSLLDNDSNDYKSPFDIMCESYLILNRNNTDNSIITIENSDYNIFSSILASIVIPIQEISNHLRFYYCKQNEKITEPLPIFLHNDKYAYYPKNKESLNIIDKENNIVNESEMANILDKSAINYTKKINIIPDLPPEKIKEYALIFEKSFPVDNLIDKGNFIDFYTLFVINSLRDNSIVNAYLNLFLFCKIFKINYDFSEKHYDFSSSIKTNEIKSIKKLIFSFFSDLQKEKTFDEIYRRLFNESCDKKTINFLSSFIQSLKEYFDNDNNENLHEVIKSLIKKMNENEY